MNRIIALSLLVVALLATSTVASAQKYGHLNSGNLLSGMSAVKSADSQMEAYQKQLVAKGEQMATTFQTKLSAYMQKAKAGEMSDIQKQQAETGLQKEQQAIAQYEQEVVAQMQKKREELLAPILQKVDTAIKAVGKEKGYTMIFDSSVMNAILFAEDADDVTALVKAKLGI